MAGVLGRSKTVVATVNVRDGDARQFLLRYIFEAAKVDAVHLPDGRVGSHSERTHATNLAEEVVVLLGVEQILSQLGLSGQKPEPFGLRNSRPEARSAADGAVAPVGALREIELGFELHRTAVATPSVGLQHSRFIY